jgi:hypothetical protein
MRSRYIKILLFAFVYLTGRISLVTHYNIGEEDKRFINFQAFPQNISNETSVAFQKEKQTPSLIRKKVNDYFFYRDVFVLRFPIPKNSLKASLPVYNGHYIDPPKLA